ncbi:MAG TPA: M56 family metallopeptidase [Verrucomicrobiae bacterium]|nr:M56 family metallopeptidase [Verrucomicrobiae bacterium]
MDTYLTTPLLIHAGAFWAATWRSAVLLAVVATVMLLWQRGAAATRHWVWVTTFVCLLCLPVFVNWFPTWQAPAWTVPSSLNAGLPTSLMLDLAKPARAASTPAAPVTRSGAVVNPRGMETGWSRITQMMDWRALVLAVWLAGALVELARFLGAAVQLHGMARRARPDGDRGRLNLVDELRAEYRIGRRVRLLLSDESLMPMTWGVWHPIMVLPAGSSDWPVDRLRVVLRHELAHVKRWDCFTQAMAYMACALYWFNPLTWFASRQMRAARELACDDLVLNTGARPSDYAGHLVEIAGHFTSAPRLAAVPMVRTSGLKQRVNAILDPRRRRTGVTTMMAAAIALIVFGFGLVVGGVRLEAALNQLQQPWSLDRSAVSAQLKAFVAEKEAQASALAATNGEELVPEFKSMFAAAAKGDWPTMSNIWVDVRNHHSQYQHPGSTNDVRLHTVQWQPAMETFGAFEQFTGGDEKYMVAIGQDIIRSIPPGSIYFGGTDPGRFLVTALSKSQINADPFFTLTQNALADSTYIEYLRSMYGSRIAIPTDEDMQHCFQDYVEDATRRVKENKLGADEGLTNTNGHVNVTGVGAVMNINGRMVRLIFDRNPGHEFYIEESYVLDWMFPYVEPHGLILKLNREKLTQLDPAVVVRDRAYWDGLTKQLLADPKFLGNKWVRSHYAKLRSTIGGVYSYRKLTSEAEYAFKQALTLDPVNPEANFRLAQLYAEQKRLDDGIAVLKSLQQRVPADPEIQAAISQMESLKQPHPVPTSDEPEKPMDGGKATTPTYQQDAVLHIVPFVQGPHFLRDGDSIVITEVLSSSPDFKVGDTVKVTGRYTLSSKPQARLCLFVTTTGNSGATPIVSQQTKQVLQGSGEFVLSETITDEGHLHLTFYDPDGGNPFGGLYFGAEQQMQEIAGWNVKDWYTK